MPEQQEEQDTPDEQDELAIQDIIDIQLESSDGFHIGRVADVLGEWQEDGRFVITHLVSGPQALAGRVALPLRGLFQAIFHDRFEVSIPISEVQEFGPTLRLRGKANDYRIGESERWIAAHILRWLPGSGYRHDETNNTDAH